MMTQFSLMNDLRHHFVLNRGTGAPILHVNLKSVSMTMNKESQNKECAGQKDRRTLSTVSFS